MAARIEGEVRAMSRIRVTWKPSTGKRPETVYVDYNAVCIRLTVDEAGELCDRLADELEPK